MEHGSLVDHGAERGLALARVAGGDGRRLGREFFGKSVGHGVNDDDPLGGHADLALVHEGTESRRRHRSRRGDNLASQRAPSFEQQVALANGYALNILNRLP